jgi:hypothetical protein
VKVAHERACPITLNDEKDGPSGMKVAVKAFDIAQELVDLPWDRVEKVLNL